MGDVLYLDSSAVVKLIVPEPETEAVVAECARWAVHASSLVCLVEVGLAVRRADGDRAALDRTDRVLGALDLVPLDETVAQHARSQAPPTLRALDAIHLISAQTLGEDLGGFLTFDRRQREAADAAGIVVLPRG